MIIQLSAIFSSLTSGLGSIIRAAAPAAIDIGKQFLQREINRKLGTDQRRAVQAQAVQVLNTPGISVARLGGTTQPVGGRVQRSTFTPAALTPAQSAIGNIPLLPVRSTPLGMVGPRLPFGFPQPSNFPITPELRRAIGGRKNGMAGQGPLNLQFDQGKIRPKYSKDEMGNTIMFVPSPRGEGFISVQQARALNLSAMKPWWRFNREEAQFEKIKPRRMNPFNFRATARAGRRVERSLDAVKELVRIEKKMTTGKVRLKKRKKRR